MIYSSNDEVQSAVVEPSGAVGARECKGGGVLSGKGTFDLDLWGKKEAGATKGRLLTKWPDPVVAGMKSQVDRYEVVGVDRYVCR